MKGGEGAGRVQPEDRAEITRTPLESRAIEIARVIGNQPAEGRLRRHN